MDMTWRKHEIQATTNKDLFVSFYGTICIREFITHFDWKSSEWLSMSGTYMYWWPVPEPVVGYSGGGQIVRGKWGL